MYNISKDAINFNIITLMGFLSCKLPDEVIKVLDDDINEMIDTNFKDSTDYNYRLAGVIEHEYLLEKEKSKNAIMEVIDYLTPIFWSNWGDARASKKHHILVNTETFKEDLWVNFQKKYEHNPSHHHSGDLSFVIWKKIPYNLEEERKASRFGNDERSRSAGVFSFEYPDSSMLGGIRQYRIPLSKDHENILVLFPSFLLHSVYPFYSSDDYRISISGNLYASDE